jgi:hypothetical protein
MVFLGSFQVFRNLVIIGALGAALFAREFAAKV